MSLQILALGVLALQTACASGYKPESISGGFAEMQLADGLYEVRYQGNSFTRRSEASKLLMRRCAELTLEHGLRYFVTIGAVVDSAVGEAADPGVQARIKLLEQGAEDPGALDAIRIVEETEAEAAGKLSAKARETIRLLTAKE